MFKKLTKLLLASVMSISLCACASGNKLNANRGTNYKYDFVNYLNVKLAGSNGHGFLIIEPRDLDVSEFNSEEEFINVKKAITELKLSYDPDNLTADTYLQVTPASELSNGDIVTLSVSDNYEGTSAKDLSINIEPYEFEIEGLDEPKDLDIFDSTSLALLALDDGTNTIYPVKIEEGLLSDEMLEKIEYTAETEDTKPVTGKTIINVSAAITPLTDEDGNPLTTSLATWFGEQGYVIKTEGEKVLREIATPVTFTSKNKEVAAKRLYSALKEDDAYLLSIANIQQVMATDSSYDPYVYTVTYYAVPNETYSSNENNSAAICKRASVRMAYSKTAGVSVLDIVSSGSGTNGEYCLAAYNSMSVKAQYTNDTSTVNMDNTEELTVDGANDTTATFTPETTTETETNE